MTLQTKPPSDLDLIRSQAGNDGLTLPQSNDAQLWARFQLAAALGRMTTRVELTEAQAKARTQDQVVAEEAP